MSNAGLPVNALGYAGLLLARTDAEVEAVRAVQPLTVLAECAGVSASV
ncbi:hypothetical protein EON68_02810 [archaeon]|nr:MAG: hypothetical protein EON68_02810 [archaeon]